MSCTLKKSEVSLLNAIIRQPAALPLRDYGMKEYHCADENASRNLIRIRRWFEKKILNAKYKEGHEGESEYIIGIEINEVSEFKLKVSYRDFLVSVVEHYKAIGQSTTYNQDYFGLLWKLKGEKFEDESPVE